MKSITSFITILLTFGLLLFSAKPCVSDERTYPDNDICPVHGIKMKQVELHVVYGIPSRIEFKEMRVAKSIFPYGRDYVLGGCTIKPQKTRQGFICSGCVKERQAWLASQDYWDKISRASQASLEEFFAMVNSRDIDEALKCLAPAKIEKPSDRAAWRGQLSAIRSIHVLDVEPTEVNSWSDSRHIFKVTLEAHVEDSTGAPIPFFGWSDNPNVRWITMELDSRRRWIVAEIATGP